jgi:hypothetical protein
VSGRFGPARPDTPKLSCPINFSGAAGTWSLVQLWYRDTFDAAGSSNRYVEGDLIKRDRRAPARRCWCGPSAPTGTGPSTASTITRASQLAPRLRDVLPEGHSCTAPPQTGPSPSPASRFDFSELVPMPLSPSGRREGLSAACLGLIRGPCVSPGKGATRFRAFGGPRVQAFACAGGRVRARRRRSGFNERQPAQAFLRSGVMSRDELFCACLKL